MKTDNQSGNPPHGLMFHHFCDDKHPRGQGAISSDEFEALLHFVGVENIVAPDDWMRFNQIGQFPQNKYCITFDDNLRCQFDVALPVLDKLGLKAFWFSYTSPMLGIPERLEVYRYFRTVFFDQIDDFYNVFFEKVNVSTYSSQTLQALKGFSPETFYSNYRFYSYLSQADWNFRYVRDHVLGQEHYYEIMNLLLDDHGVKEQELLNQLWLNETCLKELYESGHTIGLHSHTHPTTLGECSRTRQFAEYAQNQEILEGIVGSKIECVSFPCNSYNPSTLEIMAELGVHTGFCANLLNLEARLSALELPRQNHAHIMRKMNSRDIESSCYTI